MRAQEHQRRSSQWSGLRLLALSRIKELSSKDMKRHSNTPTNSDLKVSWKVGGQLFGTVVPR